MKAIQEDQFKLAVQQVAPYIGTLALRMIVAREAGRPQNSRLHVSSYPMLAVASVLGYIRHNLTAYDYLLKEQHLTRFQAQQKVYDEVQRHFNKFCKRP